MPLLGLGNQGVDLVGVIFEDLPLFDLEREWRSVSDDVVEAWWRLTRQHDAFLSWFLLAVFLVFVVL